MILSTRRSSNDSLITVEDHDGQYIVRVNGKKALTTPDFHRADNAAFRWQYVR